MNATENEANATENEANATVMVVVARYNEDLSWMREHPFNLFRYIVYNKGVNDEFEKCNVVKTIPLSNVGKCDHTYLYHLVTHYERLNDITVFLPGCLNCPFKKQEAMVVLNGIAQKRKAVFYAHFAKHVSRQFHSFTLDEWSSTDPANRHQNPETKTLPAAVRPFGKWFAFMFGPRVQVDWFCLHGIFSVDKRDVRQHPKSRYTQLMNTVSSHSNPEAGHFIERSWAAVFHPLRETVIVPRNGRTPHQRHQPALRF